MRAPASSLPSVDLAAGTLVIADLHLDVGPRSAGRPEFSRFLRAIRGAPRLIVLGDLFDAWIGPAQMALPPARDVVRALRGLRDAGTAIDVLAGNRDFLMEQRFEEASGACVRPHGLVGVLANERVLILHGDELCTLDHGYQRLKRVLRSRPLLWSIPRLPAPLALAIARRLRRASTRAVDAKPAHAKEQQATEVVRLARAGGYSTLVCGHSHVFRDERVAAPDTPPPGAGGAALRWIVLDAFGGGRDVLQVGPAGELEARASATFEG